MLEMLPCPLEPAGAGDRAGVGAFPEVNRVLAGRLLGLLVERMVRATGGSGGECGEHHGEAALGAG